MNADLSIPDAETQPLASSLLPRPAALLAAPRGKLAAALARAISAVTAVEKNAAVAYGNTNYAYASADVIIEEGRKALAGAELVLLPIDATLDGSERDGPDRFELRRTFLLLHSSGESAPLHVCWPVVPEKGRPLDKATAAADTLSLSYLLRDLLLMNRVAPGDDVAGRKDEPAPNINAKAVKELLALLTRKNFSVKSVLKKYQLRNLRELAPVQLEELTAKLNTYPDGGSTKAAPPAEQPTPQQQPIPAQQPASASGDHDPAELIDQGRKLGLARLLQQAALQFSDCKPALGLSPTVGLSDLTYAQADALAEEIARRAKLNAKPKGA